MTKDWYLGGVWFHVDTDIPQALTVFMDDRYVPAVPNPGEGADWWHHDLLHSLLAVKMGKPCSPTLYAVAHEMPVTDEHYLEESMVMAFGRYLKDESCKDDPDLYRLAEFGDLAEIRRALILEIGTIDDQARSSEQ